MKEARADVPSKPRRHLPAMLQGRRWRLRRGGPQQGPRRLPHQCQLLEAESHDRRPPGQMVDHRG